MPLFLRSERRKGGNCLFTANTRSGKAVNAAFPPPYDEEKLQMQLPIPSGPISFHLT